MTATRKAATIAAASALWLVAAWLLWRTEVPDVRLPHVDVHALFTRRELARASRHERLLDWLWVAETLVQLVVLVLGARRGPSIASRMRGPRVARAAAAAVLVYAAASFATLPLHAVGHWLERRYEVTHEAWGPWLVDFLRAVGLELVVVAVAAAALSAIAARVGRRWWPAGAGAVVAVGAATVLLGPLTAPGGSDPLRNRSVARDIDALARREGVSPPPRVVVERASKRTTLANAEAVGLGPTERIVLWDTLLDGRYTRDQIRFVAAHELAHIHRHHLWKGVAWLVLFAVPSTWLLSRLADPADPAQVPRAVLVVVLIQLVLLPVTNTVSRRYEQEADWLGMSATRDPAAARALFVRFAELSLARPQPPEWSHILFDDHPTYLQRIELTEAWRLRNRAAASPAGPGSP